MLNDHVTRARPPKQATATVTTAVAMMAMMAMMMMVMMIVATMRTGPSMKM
jgi:hypothetical protein